MTQTFHDKEKAIHQALWLTFKHRVSGIQYGVVKQERLWEVVDVNTVSDTSTSSVYIPTDYANISHDTIRHIKMDDDPLWHTEEIFGLFSSTDGELLRYILHTRIPLEMLIRHELAVRGFDENHLWVGFKKAREIWIGNG